MEQLKTGDCQYLVLYKSDSTMHAMIVKAHSFASAEQKVVQKLTTTGVGHVIIQISLYN